MITEFEDSLTFIPDSDIRNWVGPFQDKCFYHELGLSQARKLKNWLHIAETSKVLDIGCGCGRIALHFLNDIYNQGSYHGFDCSTDLVDFCNRNLAVHNTVFTFEQLNVRNGAYNPAGATHGSSVTFPYGSDTFTSAFAWSVFTHMDFDAVQQYIRETARVLSQGGLFLHNTECPEFYYS